MSKYIALLLVWLSIWNLATPLAVAAPNANLQDLLQSVSSPRLVQQVDTLAKYSRCLLDPGHDEAGSYIKNEIKELGLLPIVQRFEASDVRGKPKLENIMVRFTGTNPQKVHLLIAHWDSSPTRFFPPACNGLAAGANDNGSGTAALLEIARVLTTGDVAFQDDIQLVWVDGEEFGYLGSQYFVKQWVGDRLINPQSLPLGSVLNLDMIGYKGDKAKGEVWSVASGGASLGLANEGLKFVKEYLPDVNYKVYTIGDSFAPARDPNRNSDQQSFWQAGLGTAIFLTEDTSGVSSGDPMWHTPNDKLRKADNSLRLDPTLLAESTQVALLISGLKAGIADGRLFGGLDLAFEQSWSRADRPVRLAARNGSILGRSWLWGPQPRLTRSEFYLESHANSRQVVYFDKARMELNNDQAVTNGLLVTEMTTGQIQLGNNRFEKLAAANIAVAGDSQGNDNAPTYTSFQTLVVSGAALDQTKQPIENSLNKMGQIGLKASSAPTIYNAYYAAQTGHNIADKFWEVFQASGKIYDPLKAQYGEGQVYDWVSTVGLPLSESYWVRAKVGGIERDVLIQLFERRVLTYTPSNDPEWQVEMGNVGLHYLAWRYGNG